MPGGQKLLDSRRDSLPAAYGAASLRVSRRIKGRNAESVNALYQEGEEGPFFSGPNPDPKTRQNSALKMAKSRKGKALKALNCA